MKSMVYQKQGKYLLLRMFWVFDKVNILQGLLRRDTLVRVHYQESDKLKTIRKRHQI